MQTTLTKIYAGFLGMNVGIRLGAPVEPGPWDFARIAEYYGDIRSYLKNFRNFAADDDVNGPVYFLRALLDNGIRRPLTPNAVGDAWLNYARDGIGLYWWGGEGISTEHTAYNNLKRGIPAPHSGSIEQNGIVLAEQIGGQIFIDTWGLICPGEPRRAAELAVTAASVSHDGNGLYGAAFIAACIAAAFTAASVDEILDAGMAEIPQSSTYAAVVRAVRAFHAAHPEDFRRCMQFLIDEWGYDRYPGVCHIIPNAGVCILSLLYGNGDFSRTVEIASMCGWDTDCNAGNVGTIAGVFAGLSCIPTHYRAPVNDFIVLSGISGYLNNLDAASYAKFLYQLSRLLHGREKDASVTLPRGGELLFDFSLPGATHGLRLSNEIRFMKHASEGALEVVIDRILPEDTCRVYYKPFYRRADFDDERYKPVFSPTVYSGQLFCCDMTPKFYIPGAVFVRPYVRTAMCEREYLGERVALIADERVEMRYLIPDTEGDCIAELGFTIEAAPETMSRIFARLRIERFAVTGKGSYRIDTALCRREFLQQTPFSLNHGKWTAEGGCLVCEAAEPAQAFTGNYYATDVSISSSVTPLDGVGAALIARGAGARRFTAAGFLREGHVGVRCHSNGQTHELLAHFDWKSGETYLLSFKAFGQKATLFVDDMELISTELPMADYGMIGFSQEAAGRTAFDGLSVLESGGFADWLPMENGVRAFPKAKGVDSAK